MRALSFWNPGVLGPFLLAAALANPGVGWTACRATAVAGGAAHTLALDQDGTAWSWGANDRGQLGNGTNTDAVAPVHVSGISGLAAVAAGGEHSLALTTAGGVTCWGANTSGQLGDGATTDRSTPVPVSGLTNVAAIAAGGEHSLALLNLGAVRAWGLNSSGQLGDGTTTSSATPVGVGSLAGVSAVAAGKLHSLALKGDGTVWAWGANARGQLGDGTTTDRTAPVQVSGLTSVNAIAAGGGHSLAVKTNGTVWAWGANDSGQLGDGTLADRHTPVQVSGLTLASVVAAGETHSLARRSDLSARAWGSNQYGQLGDGTGTSSSTPVAVAGVDPAGRVASGANHGLLLTPTGLVAAWGRNHRGQLGTGTTVNALAPVSVDALLVGEECACRGVVDHVVGYNGPQQTLVYNFLQSLPYATVTGQIRTPLPANITMGAYTVRLQNTTFENQFYMAVDGQAGVRYREKDCPRYAPLCQGPNPRFPYDPGFRAENNSCEFQEANDKERYQQWGLGRTGFEAAWSRIAPSPTKRRVIVAVLDTGANLTHPDLGSAITHDLDIVNGTRTEISMGDFGWQNDADGAMDDNLKRHGTMVAGVIGATTSSQPFPTPRGVAGGACFGCTSWPMNTGVVLHIYKVLNAEAVGKPSDVAAGITLAKQYGAEVINLSLGSFSDSQVVREACQSARQGQTGAILVAAAGNWGESWVLYPAAYTTVLGVGATLEQETTHAWWSNHGVGVDIYAPGENVLSTGDLPYGAPLTSYAYSSGTSLAAPMVTAAVALARALNPPQLCSSQIEQALRTTGVPPMAPERVLSTAGLIDALRTASGPPQCSDPPTEPPFGTLPPDTGDPFFNGGGLIPVILEPSAIP